MSGFFFLLEVYYKFHSWNSLYSIIATFSGFILISCTQFANELVIPLFIDASLSDIYLSHDEEAVNLDPLILEKEWNLESNCFCRPVIMGCLFCNNTSVR